MPPDSQEFVGKEIARARLKTFLDAVQIDEQQQEAERVLPAPDVLLNRGSYAIETTPRKGGEASFDAGTYLTIWRKNDGKCRISYQIWTSHRAPRDGAAPAAGKQGGAR